VLALPAVKDPPVFQQKARHTSDLIGSDELLPG
jgi:hypothetical protein